MATLLQRVYIDGYGNCFELWAEETYTDAYQNYSTVHDWLELHVVSGGWVESYNIKVGLTGGTEDNLGYKYYGPGTHKLKECSFFKTHNVDGSGSANITGYFSGGIGTWSLNGTLGLRKFSREASMNSFLGMDITKSFRADYTKQNNDPSFEYRLRISIPRVTALQTFRNYVSGSYVYLSSSTINYIKNYTSAKTITLGGVIETWSGNVKVGESEEWTLTATIKKPARIRIQGLWREATPYVRVNGTWREATPYMRVNGTWKEES